MAAGSTAPKTTDDAKTDNTEVNITDPREHVRVDTAEAHTDRVAMVSRDKNGKPDQSDDYEIVNADELTAHQKRVAENRPSDNQVS